MPPSGGLLKLVTRLLSMVWLVDRKNHAGNMGQYIGSTSAGRTIGAIRAAGGPGPGQVMGQSVSREMLKNAPLWAIRHKQTEPTTLPIAANQGILAVHLRIPKVDTVQ